MASVPVARVTRRRRLNTEVLVVSMVFAAGMVLIVLGFLWSRTGDDALHYPEAIESTAPAPNDRQVLHQSEIRVQLKSGYEATLALDGVSLPTTNFDDLQGAGGAQPGQQIVLPPTAIFDQANAVIWYQPTDGAPIEELTQGIHIATVTYWKFEDGPATAESFTWQFEVL